MRLGFSFNFGLEVEKRARNQDHRNTQKEDDCLRIKVEPRNVSKASQLTGYQNEAGTQVAKAVDEVHQKSHIAARLKGSDKSVKKQAVEWDIRHVHTSTDADHPVKWRNPACIQAKCA